MRKILFILLLIPIIGYSQVFVSYKNGSGSGLPSPFVCGTSTVDYGGQRYNTVDINGQCWLKENLNIGTKIDSNVVASDNSIIEKYCYGGLDANCTTYGGLYLWDEAMQYVTTEGRQGICPPGWHIPTYTEFCALETFLQTSGSCTTSNDAGGHLKEDGTTHWTTPNTGADNSSGFTALPAGIRSWNSRFLYSLTYTFMWTSTLHDTYLISYYGLAYNSQTFQAGTRSTEYGLNYGQSVRCIKD